MKIAKGQVIVAVDPAGVPLGYCMSVDRYFKRTTSASSIR